MSARSRTFRDAISEVLPLPDAVAFGEGVDVVLVRSGNVLTVYPAASTISEMAARLRTLPVPPAVQVRDVDDWPERPKP